MTSSKFVKHNILKNSKNPKFLPEISVASFTPVEDSGNSVDDSLVRISPAILSANADAVQNTDLFHYTIGLVQCWFL